MRAPAGGELHLWFCHRDGLFDSGVFQRELLSRYAGVAPGELNITRGEHGKPGLTSPRLPLAFNYSDCRDRAVLAISAGPEIGVDLEYCDPGRDIEKLARRFFSRQEVHNLLSCAGSQRLSRFYDFWTLKEATVKAAGGSLGRELELTRFDLTGPGRIGACTPGRLRVENSSLREDAWIALLQPFAGYRLALCCLAARDFSAGLMGYHWPQPSPLQQPLTLLAVSSTENKTTSARHL